RNFLGDRRPRTKIARRRLPRPDPGVTETNSPTTREFHHGGEPLCERPQQQSSTIWIAVGKQSRPILAKATAPSMSKTICMAKARPRRIASCRKRGPNSSMELKVETYVVDS